MAGNALIPSAMALIALLERVYDVEDSFLPEKGRQRRPSPFRCRIEEKTEARSPLESGAGPSFSLLHLKGKERIHAGVGSAALQVDPFA